MIEIGSREREQPAPPPVVWASLMEPHDPRARAWLSLLADEVEPRVLEEVEPSLVVWSSLWPSRPDDQIRFDLRPESVGTALRWTLLGAGESPSPSLTGHLRFRLNKIINADLRFSYGQ